MFDFIDKRELKGRNNILFVCHESSRTGAPISLLTFIKWIKDHTDQPFVIVIEKGGDLDESFRAMGPTRVVRPQKMNIFKRIWSKIHYPSYVSFRLESFMEESFGLIYHNTIGRGFLLSILKEKLRCPVITHIHELEGVIQSTGISNVRRIKLATNHYIAASRSVKENLVKNHQIPPSKITVHLECIPSIPDHIETKQIQLPIIINDSDFVVGGAGFIDYRKGFDIFLETARSLIRENHRYQFKFIWVGGFGRNKQKIVEDFIKKNELTDFVCFLGERKDPYTVFKIFNLFFLTSREDPYPLVMLENACLGIPVMGFESSGGIKEFLRETPDLLLKEITISHAVNQLMLFSKDSQRMKDLGMRLRNKVLENHTIDSCGKRYYEDIKQLGNIK